jgi:hypothetical protein
LARTPRRWRDRLAIRWLGLAAVVMVVVVLIYWRA